MSNVSKTTAKRSKHRGDRWVAFERLPRNARDWLNNDATLDWCALATLKSITDIANKRRISLTDAAAKVWIPFMNEYQAKVMRADLYKVWGVELTFEDLFS